MNTPYHDLGIALRGHRIAINESLEDVSGAVEINPERLQKIEEGEELPPLDVLDLLIRHFELRENDAVRLWEMAGYGGEPESVGELIMNQQNKSENDSDGDKKLSINVPSDNKIIYTDMVHVVSNKFGVVMNFVQGMGPNGKPTVVTSLGMSREHAESVVEVLKRSLEKNSENR